MVLIASKRLHFLPLLLAGSQLASAAWENLTLADYRLKQGAVSPVIAKLDALLPRASVGDVMADLNHVTPAVTPNVKNLVANTGYTWESTDGYDDKGTSKWYPQGITTSADAFESGTYEGHRVQMISWHSDKYDGGKRGARVSFVKRGATRGEGYRNVLLVQPKGADDFQAIAGLHAGGMLWYGNLVYVVDTTLGLRVFDLDHMYKVDTSVSDGIGRHSNGKFGAYGYKYVLPQVRTYTWQSKDGVKDLRHSFVSLDRTTTPDSILVGEYNAVTFNNRLIRWNIDYTTRLLVTSGGIATASQAVSHDNLMIQGATTINGKFFLTQSLGAMLSWDWVKGKKTTSGTFPTVPEDVSYEKGVGLWTLMENPGNNRQVFAIDPSKF